MTCCFGKHKIMKYEKIIANIFAQNSKNNAQVGFALVAGLAIGAALGVLFAPKSGAKVRKGISNKAKGLGGDARDLYSSLRSRITGDTESSEPAPVENQHLPHTPAKKPKSDIKELIHEAHVNGAHSEPSVS